MRGLRATLTLFGRPVGSRGTNRAKSVHVGLQGCRDGPCSVQPPGSESKIRRRARTRPTRPILHKRASSEKCLRRLRGLQPAILPCLHGGAAYGGLARYDDRASPARPTDLPCRSQCHPAVSGVVALKARNPSTLPSRSSEATWVSGCATRANRDKIRATQARNVGSDRS